MQQPEPAKELRERLTVARRQRVPFAVAWDEALNGHGTRLRWPHDTTERRAARAALEETRPAWEAAYHHEAFPGGEVFARLLDLLDAEEPRPSPPPFVPLKVSEPEHRRRAA